MGFGDYALELYGACLDPPMLFPVVFHMLFGGDYGKGGMGRCLMAEWAPHSRLNLNHRGLNR